ncbi:MAG TPA: response regulator [Dehalococcoidia bacterium]|nr:response regulator [Dehalococcoidia bacterium]
MKVLVVEDDQSLAGIMRRSFVARGHETWVAGTAEGAILQMAEQWPDVLIMDVNLPDFTAWEVLRRLGPEDRQALKVIVVSAAPISRKRLEEFKPAGALQKPFTISSLLHLAEGDEVIEPVGPEQGRSGSG